MKIVIVDEKNNPHMARREIIIYIDHVAGSTPSRAAIQQFVAKDFGVGVERVEVKNIFSSVGKQQSRAKIFVWDQKRAEDLSKAKPKDDAKASSSN